MKKKKKKGKIPNYLKLKLKKQGFIKNKMKQWSSFKKNSTVQNV